MRVLFIDIDTLRPDHMSCYGYGRLTTPNLDAVCREGIRFDRYYCSDAPCLPSRAALVSGQFGIHNGVVGHGGTAADRRLTGPKREFTDQADEENLHNIFRRAGLYTVSVSTFAERHSAWWFNAGFRECVNVGGRGGESGEVVLPEALAWLERNRDRKDWFLHVHLWDPHTPYRAPASFGDPFRDVPLPDPWIDESVLSLHLRHTGPHCINEIGMFTDQIAPGFPRQPGSARDLDGVKRVMDSYDTGILYCDSLIGRIFEALKAQGIWEDTAVIITSDHGEDIGELGVYAEHGFADECTCRIPFILRWPGARRGAVDRGLHYSLDLLPTLCDLLGQRKSARWDGRSFAASVVGNADTGRDSLVLSQMAHVCQRSARFEDWLYIRTYHDGYHLLDREMLFNLRDDPHEQHDVKSLYPDVVARGAKILLDWFDDQMLRSPYDTDPMMTVLHEDGPYHTWTDLPAYIRRLEETGRADGARALREKYLQPDAENK